jgi:hypothetical protein
MDFYTRASLWTFGILVLYLILVYVYKRRVCCCVSDALAAVFFKGFSQFFCAIKLQYFANNCAILRSLFYVPGS